ncbi:hypothetical protein CCAX7_17260 [Capsulimonas corticalis]|uniref:Uncharacterized protein n=1 Tax=Capsulimonas corticalis TaxID=2219043 RepID=A0A402D3Z9_9BACT|nr:type II toxin-antitoxin system RelE/ParE family toxin [Capsulimonas corticalis]BDI29675.1 hypothetical protein CCAX7_17260 [Capsulimonas corticalis]
MDDRSGQSERVIRFTEAALLDLAGIDNATAAMWGAAQAELYLSFLEGVLRVLANNPAQGVVIDQYPQYRSSIARLKNRKSAYGHRIFYREIEGGILVIRILHTAMHWPSHIAGD